LVVVAVAVVVAAELVAHLDAAEAADLVEKLLTVGCQQLSLARL
jgi:hypothetical protein